LKVQKKIKISLSGSDLQCPVKVVEADTAIQLILEYIDFTIPAGTTATLYVRKPSGKRVYQTNGITISGNVITINLENQAIIESGVAYFTVTLKNGSDTISTFSNYFDVDKNYKGVNPEESRTVITEIDALLQEVKDIAGIGGAEGVSVPAYVRTEAERVVKDVIAAQGTRMLNIGTIADCHVCPKNFDTSNVANNNWAGAEQAITAMGLISKKIKLNAVVDTGDFINGDVLTTAQGWLDIIGNFNEMRATIKADEYKVEGNHDQGYGGSMYIPAEKSYPYISAYNDKLVLGDVLRGYGYKDFDNLKVRMIILNTTEYTSASDSGLIVTNKQYEWFARALDLSGKESPSEWQTLIVSHHPLDWSGTVFTSILSAYEKGTSVTVNGKSINYNGKNSALIIGNIHGHLHNMLKGKISGTSINRWCCPNINHDYSNTYTNWQEANTYVKKLGTKRATAFVVYAINLDEKTVSRIHYGAGYSDSISYISDGAVPDESGNGDFNGDDVEEDLGGESGDNTGGSTGGDVSGDDSGGSGSDNESGGDTGSTEDNGIGPTVEGNLVTTSIDASGAIYNGKGYKNGYRLNSSGEEKDASDITPARAVTGFMKAKQGNRIYAQGIGWDNSLPGSNYIAYYDASFKCIKSVSEANVRGNLGAYMTTDGFAGIFVGNNWGSEDFSTVEYIRISGAACGSNFIVKVNETI
jgi:hypothetical protein